jgi:hypothetical protein
MRIGVFVASALLVGSCFAQNKPTLTGEWQPESSGAQGPKLSIHLQTDRIELKDLAAADDRKTEIVCSTKGKECEAKIAGEPVRLSYYFNGPVLVEMAYYGKNNDRIVRTRRSLSEDGTKMNVEVMEVTTGKSPETQVFVRSAVQAKATP